MEFATEEEKDDFYWHLDRLIADLERAERFIWKYQGPKPYQEQELFLEELECAIIRLKADRLEMLDNLWSWFSPMGEWEEFTRPRGVPLGQKVFGKLQEINALIK